MRSRRVPALVALAILATPASARVLMTQEEALAQAFPNAAITRLAHVLDEAQLEAVERLAGERPDSAAVFAYRATRDGALLGTAYFDAHVVRTLPEVLLVVVTPAGTVERVDVLAFREPDEYRAPAKWLAQFEGRALDRDLQVKRGIHGLTGATLSARAATRAVRRVLAVHEVLEAEAASAPHGS